MAYLPPPPTPVPRGRRPPRWTPPDLGRIVATYVDGQPVAARRLRRHLVPTLTRLAEAGRGTRAGRHAVAQTAVSAALAGLESGSTRPEPVAVAFRAIAHVIEATGHVLPDLATLDRSERALVRLVEIELADRDRLARALAVPADELESVRATVAHRLGITPTPDSECPGWSEVRRRLRDPGDRGAEHRATCGRCALVADLVEARRRRLWAHGVPPGGPFGPVFDPRH